MDVLNFLWTYVLPFLVVLTVLVFVHELGHYWVARRNDVRVEVFSVGFGREIWGRTDRVGTRWRLSLIPLGGYVKFFGESEVTEKAAEEARSPSPEELARAFHTKRVGQRAAIVFAGPAANFLFAFVLLVGLFVTVGQPFTPTLIATVIPESAAEQAGFRAGDVVKRIDDVEIERFEAMQAIVSMSAGRTLRIVVLRDGAEVVLTAKPRLVEIEDPFGNKQTIGQLGVAREGVEYRRLGPATASWQALNQMVTIVDLTVRALGQIVVGERSASELGGPVRIAQMSGKIAENGAAALIWFMTLLSVNLGLINLFPIPVLDGGHLVFYAIEAIRGKPVTERIQEFSFRIGLALVLMLMLFATWNDLVQLEFFEFLSRIFS